mgnify:FL=1
MADPRFFGRSAPLSVEVIAEITGAKLISEAATCPHIKDVSPIDTAGPGDVTFIENRKYVDLVANTQASACFISSDLVDRAHPNLILLLTDRPRRCFATIANIMYPRNKIIPTIHQTATISETAVIGEDCQIDAGVVIGPFVKIGKGCSIGSNVTIGENVHIGQNTWIGPNASISHAELGVDCVIYPGARIGQPGFGFEIDASGPIDMPQLGLVKIGDNVEIGANTTVDRGAGPDTIIGNGTRIDNLVQIGHNVRLGNNCVIVAQVGIAGSTTIGNNTVIAGQSGLAGHINIGNNVQIAAQSGVTKSLSDWAVVGGSPAVPIKQFRKQVAVIKSMSRNIKK